MGQLYSFENGILVPYTLNTPPKRSASPGYAMVSNAAVSGVEPVQQNQINTNQGNLEQNSSAVEQPRNVQQYSADAAQQSAQAENMAYNDLYMQAMAKIAEQDKVIATLQADIAKQAIIGKENALSDADIDAAFDKFFGYSE